MRDVIVVGGGISGLATAFWLQQDGLDVLVLEAHDEVGGVMRSYGSDGFLFERGPNSFLDNRETTGRLLDEAGLRNKLVLAASTAKKRFIYRLGAIREVPSHPLRFLQSKLLSPKGLARLLAEPFLPGMEPADEETLADFMDRRIGREARKVLVDAFVSGIYAGASEELSARAAFPSMIAAERKYGSIALGLLGGGQGAQAATAMCSFREGMGALPRELTTTIGPQRVYTSAAVKGITEREEGGFSVAYTRQGESHAEGARAVILATPASTAASLLEPFLSVEAIDALLSIRYAPITVAGVGLPNSAFQQGVPEGFGFLVPRDEGIRALGCIYSSAIFPDRAPHGHTALTLFIGGSVDPEGTHLDDDALQLSVMKDLEMAFGVSDAPSCFHVQRWPHAIPQYTLGHINRRQRIDMDLQNCPGLHCAGNYLRGISIHDAIDNAYQTARNVILELKANKPL